MLQVQEHQRSCPVFIVRSHLHHAIHALLSCLLTGDSIIHPKMQNREVDCNIDQTVFHLPSEFQCAKRQTPNARQRYASLMPGTGNPWLVVRIHRKESPDQMYRGGFAPLDGVQAFDQRR
jgi:hypothetical protein